MTNQQRKKGNLFARELEEILAAHGQNLSRLDPHLGISESKAWRLQRSLQEAGSLPVLSLDELESLEMELPLNSTEWARLRAALLATAIEHMLLERIGQDKALLAAEGIVLLLEEALREQLQPPNGSGKTRIPDSETGENEGVDRAWEAIYLALDSATLALQLSSYASSYRERVKKLEEARADFQEALNKLDRLDADVKAQPLWQSYVEGTHQELRSTLDRLNDLGRS